MTEYCHVELKDQDISQETRDRSEILKKKYPEVFSLSNQDIGHTNLVTMHVDMGDSLPICQKPYTLPLKYYSWVQQDIKTLKCVEVIKKSISPWTSPIVIVPMKSAPGEPPRRRMCINFKEINELQPKTQTVDKQTNTKGNLSLKLTKCMPICGCKNIHYPRFKKWILPHWVRQGFQSKNCFHYSFW